MTQRICVILIAFLLCSAQAPTPRPTPIVYTLTPILSDSALVAMSVDIRFRGDADGETVLRLPSSWGGETELWRGVTRLELLSGARMVASDDPTQRIVQHRPNAMIHLRYRLVQDQPGPPLADGGNHYRPLLQATYFHIIGHTALIQPEAVDSMPVVVRVRNRPRNWSYASDTEHPGLTLGRLGSSILVGGDFRVVADAESGVRVALRGAWSASDAEIAGEVREIISGQRRYWGDEASPYLVTLIPLEAPNPGMLSVGGTGLEDAFAMFVTPNAEPRLVTRLLAHEAMHTWVPGLIGGMPVVAEEERKAYWLSEGFTDFLMARVLVREGVWTPVEFAAAINETLDEYARSPVRTAPNVRIAAEFWSDQNVQKLPYQRGALLAWLWDARLRAMGRDLDDVLLAMRARARAGDELLAPDLFVEVTAEQGLDVRAEIARHVEEGAPIVLAEDTFAPCGQVQREMVRNFHRGFDIEATTAANNVIAGVRRDGPAYAAGLRDGMVLLRRDGGEIGNAEIEIIYIVRDGDSERAIRYFPRGEGSFERQRFVLRDGLEGEALSACRAALAGQG